MDCQYIHTNEQLAKPLLRDHFENLRTSLGLQPFHGNELENNVWHSSLNVNGCTSINILHPQSSRLLKGSISRKTLDCFE